MYKHVIIVFCSSGGFYAGDVKSEWKSPENSTIAKRSDKSRLLN